MRSLLVVVSTPPAAWRYETYFIGANVDAVSASPLGFGSGVASAAARHVGGGLFFPTETAFSKLAYEVGIPGILAYFWMLASVIRRARFALRNTVSRRMVLFGRGFLALAIMFFLTSRTGGPSTCRPATRSSG